LIESVLRDATITVEAQSLLPALESISCRWKNSEEYQDRLARDCAALREENAALRSQIAYLEVELVRALK
jgi:hypothetical protein